METLSSGQRKFLRGQAHSLDPVVLIGKQGLTDAVVASADTALTAHELIKVRFNDFKDQKKELVKELAERAHAQVAGVIGHVAILFRQHPDPEKRRILLPPA